MLAEAWMLSLAPHPLNTCPNCGRVFWPFMRGQVHRRKRKWLIGPKRPYLAIICYECKKVLGWEGLDGRREFKKKYLERPVTRAPKQKSTSD